MWIQASSMTLNVNTKTGAGASGSFTGSITAVFVKHLTSYAETLKQVAAASIDTAVVSFKIRVLCMSYATCVFSSITCHMSQVTRIQRVPSSRGALLPEKEMHLAAVIATGMACWLLHLQTPFRFVLIVLFFVQATTAAQQLLVFLTSSTSRKRLIRLPPMNVLLILILRMLLTRCEMHSLPRQILL
jgi:hypothetical protein